MNKGIGWLASLVFVLVMACGTKNEGCIDANASNFDVSADVNCCCIYPRMGLQFEFFYGDERFSLRDTLIDAAGDSFLIEDLRFYVSEVKFRDAQGKEYRFDKRVWLYPLIGGGKDSVFAIDDYALIDPNRRTMSGFTFLSPITFSGLDLMVGVADSAQACNPNAVKPLSHPLNIDLDSLYNFNANNYDALLLRVRGVNDNGIEGSIKIGTLGARVPYTFTLNATAPLGYDFNVLVRVQVANLLQEIRWLSDDQALIRQKLTNNLKTLLE